MARRESVVEAHLEMNPLGETRRQQPGFARGLFRSDSPAGPPAGAACEDPWSPLPEDGEGLWWQHRAAVPVVCAEWRALCRLPHITVSLALE